MFNLNNYFGPDDCFFFKFITVSSVLTAGAMWLLFS